MYTLTIQLATLKDLIDCTRKLGDHVLTAELVQNTEVKPEVIKEAKPKAAKKEKAASAQEEVPAVPTATESVNRTNESGVQSEVPLAASAPVALSEIERAALIAKASKLVADLKASGIADEEVMPNIHEVYKEAGCPLNLRIGQFDDASLVKFMPLFEKKVQSIVKPAVASFI